MTCADADSLFCSIYNAWPLFLLFYGRLHYKLQHSPWSGFVLCYMVQQG